MNRQKAKVRKYPDPEIRQKRNPKLCRYGEGEEIVPPSNCEKPQKQKIKSVQITTEKTLVTMDDGQVALIDWTNCTSGQERIRVWLAESQKARDSAERK